MFYSAGIHVSFEVVVSDCLLLYVYGIIVRSLVYGFSVKCVMVILFYSLIIQVFFGVVGLLLVCFLGFRVSGF